MIPPMNETVIIEMEDTTQPKDRYGKYPVIPTEIKANVRLTDRVIVTTDGLNKQANLEVILPPTIQIVNGQAVKAQDVSGKWHTAIALQIKEAKNFAGNRVLYRRAFCGE